VVYWLLPYTEGVVGMRRHVEVAFDGVLAQRSAEGQFSDDGEKGTVYHQLLTPQPAKGHAEAPSRKSCLDEGMTLVGAGGENTGSVTTLGTFMTISQPELTKRLQAELVEAWPDMDAPIGWEALERLPILVSAALVCFAYLTDILGWGYQGVSASGQLRCRSTSARCGAVGCDGQWTRSTCQRMFSFVFHPAHRADDRGQSIISMGHYFVHMNPKIFPNPEQFNPDRWIGPESKKLDSYLISFSRGPRMCLGVKCVFFAWL
jgi:hypothetical protein